LPTLAAALLPAALVLLWRRLGFTAPVAVLAAFLVPVAGDITAAIPGHGGLGQFVAMFALVLPVLALARALRSGGLGSSILAGLGLACLLLIHASWTVLTVLLAVIISRQNGAEPAAGRRVWLAAAVAAVVFLAATAWDLVPAAGVYKERALNPDDRLSLLTCLRMATRSTGAWWGLELVVVGAIVAGLVRRGTRPVAILALALGTLSVTLGTWQDPVSMVLSQPGARLASSRPAGPTCAPGRDSPGDPTSGTCLVAAGRADKGRPRLFHRRRRPARPGVRRAGGRERGGGQLA